MTKKDPGEKKCPAVKRTRKSKYKKIIKEPQEESFEDCALCDFPLSSIFPDLFPEISPITYTHVKPKKEEPLLKEIPKPQEYRFSCRTICFLLAYPIAITILAAVLFSCTISVTTIHTQGSAQDVVDEEQQASPTVSPNIDVPISGI